MNIALVLGLLLTSQPVHGYTMCEYDVNHQIVSTIINGECPSTLKFKQAEVEKIYKHRIEVLHAVFEQCVKDHLEDHDPATYFSCKKAIHQSLRDLE